MKKRMTLPRAILAAGALALAVTAFGCAPRQAGGDPGKTAASPARGPGIAEIAVQVVPVTIDALVVEHQTSGTVNPVMQSQVAGQVGGIVARVLRRAGDRVEKGDAIVQLDDSQLRLSLRTAQASLEASRINLSTTQDTTAQANPKLDLQVNSAESALSVAQRNYDSKKALFDLGGATGAEMDKAKSDLSMAQANLEAARTAQDQNRKADLQNIAQLKLAVDQAGFAVQQAQLNLEHASIKAPFAGRLVAVKVEEGEFVSQNAPAFIIASQEREVDFSVPPSDAPSLRVGAPVTFILGGKSYALRISQTADVPLNGVVAVTAAVPASMALTYGAVGAVRYSLTLARGALVPTGSLQTSEDRNFVYVVRAGKAEMRQITILTESGSTAVVTGVAAGDMVILNPPPGLLDGSVVKALPAPAEGQK
jgi:multidrug efflux pump subunit AcrA (membrane-fusion protein)